MRNKNLSSNKNWIKAYIVDVLPCISIAFYVLAFIYHSSFYAVFGIDIIQYTTFGDVFLSITEPLIEYALITAILIAFVFDLYNNKIYDLIEEKKKQKLKRIKHPKVYYSYMRFIVKRRQELGNIFGMNTNQKKASIIYFVFLSLMFFIACGAIFQKFIDNKELEPSLRILSVSLYLPLFVILLICEYWVIKNPKRELNNIKNLKNRPVKAAVFFACYYIYALSCFSGIGSACAKQLIENNTIVFETVTSDGTIFTDKDYGYIGHMSNETFLYNKKNMDCVILNNEGIVYTKMNSKNRKEYKDVNKSLPFVEAIYEIIERIKNSI